MTDLQPPPTMAGQLVRVTIAAGDRRLDVGAPGAIPVAELVPGLARGLGLLDPETVYGGYGLVRADGVVLDPDRSLQAQGVEDGAVLSIESGLDQAEQRTYDDVVEAVADAVESEHQAWTSGDAARTAVFASAALLVTGAVLVVAAGLAAVTAAAVCGVVAAVLLVAASVVGRTGAPSSAPGTLGVVASLYGALAGYLGAGGGAPTGWPLAWAGAGAVVAAGCGLLALPREREVMAGPLLVGLGAFGIGLATGLLGADAVGSAAAIGVAVVTLGFVGVPWLALASTPLRVLSPRDDAEILAVPPPVEPDDVRSQYRGGHRLQIALRTGAGVLLLALTPWAVGTGVFGVVLACLAFSSVLLSVRETYSRQDVVIVMTTGIVGVVVTGISAAALFPEWRSALAVAVAALAAIVVALGLVAPGRHLRLARLADTAELLLLALVLPAAVVAAGLL
ncbi:protein of unknown function DUF571 [Beutenbergia cavernae DSM 12333]|uniref:EccD-like transmembrane domain-containing protein n=1 Tax=Beutenbergia cavernae (strain ATCC BAA-8 / DSM 12333 / CCUG 43141 / JCM 11478 / NBRC 16432 / NCIMB 13614 / HKI 0122) TaxID=471853 RepID=C5C0Q2_BEUC1|nr:type VII secretion integral membrane protein EccD [Beutenbergia cavernae]ACQ81448.1 protein of unknown function DUF571 [Beutenbergia cavernae DSM 12333]